MPDARRILLSPALRIAFGALVLAVPTHLYIRGRVVVTTEVPVRARVEVSPALPPDVAAHPSTEEVAFSLQGPKAEVEGLKAQDRVIRLEIPEEVAAGRLPHREVYDLAPLLRLPARVAAVDRHPDRIEVRFERLLTRRVPVREEVTGSVRKGYQLVGLVLEPSEVEVRGPEAVVQKLLAVSTMPISLEDRTRDFTLVVPVQTRMGSGEAFEAAGEITVRGTVQPEPRQSVVKGVPVRILTTPGPQPALTLLDRAVDVTLEGPEKDLQAITVRDVRAFIEVDAAETRSGSATLEVQVRLPEGLRLRAVGTYRVRVEFGGPEPPPAAGGGR